MAYTWDDFFREVTRERLHELPPEERLVGLTPEELFNYLTSEEVLQHIRADEVEKLLEKLRHLQRHHQQN